MPHRLRCPRVVSFISLFLISVFFCLGINLGKERGIGWGAKTVVAVSPEVSIDQDQDSDLAQILTHTPFHSSLRPLDTLRENKGEGVPEVSPLAKGGIRGGSAKSQTQLSEPQSDANPPFSAAAVVEQGVERYQAGDFQGAIALWTQTLGHYDQSDQLIHKRIVLENLARAYRSVGNDDQSLHYWTQALSVQQQLIQQQLGTPQKMGQILTEQAQAHSRLGQYQQAIVQLCSPVGGWHRERLETGTETEPEIVMDCSPRSAVGIAQAEGDIFGEAAAWGSLGEVLRLQGRYDPAQWSLEQSLTLADSLQHGPYIAASTQSLGNIFMQRSQTSDRRAQDAQQRGNQRIVRDQSNIALEHAQTALNYFEQSMAATTALPQMQVQSLLSMTVLHHRTGNQAAAQEDYQRAEALLNQLPASRAKVYSLLDLATTFPLTQSVQTTGNPTPQLASNAPSTSLCFERSSDQPSSIDPALFTQQEALLSAAVDLAERLGDYRAQSFSLGQLGRLYECRQNYDKALTITHKAAWAADQDLRSPDSVYLWQWQLGRVLTQQGKTEGAIVTYKKAVNTLEKLRSDILTTNRDRQFDFRDAVVPVYRELAGLLLDQVPPSTLVPPEAQDTTAKIDDALTTIDSLKLAELQNYFGDDCLVFAATSSDIDNQIQGERTGIFSTFIDQNRTAIILTLPNGKQRIEWLEMDEAALREQVNTFRIELQRSLNYLDNYDLSTAVSLYDELIAPFLPDLETAEISTLVFVQDGIFRSAPMAALYDGETYLIEHYAVATTPSLSLNPLTRRRLSPKILALGLSNSVVANGRNWSALNGVKQELNQITRQFPGSQQFLNEAFTRDRLRQALQDDEYSVIHLATHGEFGAEPQDTFLLTGDGDTLTIGDLERAIRQSGTAQTIDLLALTACKTAVGDNRSTLGLAGVAVQAGVRSAIASLWSINDTSTADLMTTFYQALNQPDRTKAQALQTAQLSLLERDDVFSRPGFWAPFVLVGDWQ